MWVFWPLWQGFTAAQVAEKIRVATPDKDKAFTAAQVAEKLSVLPPGERKSFTAAQVAEKGISGRERRRLPVHCRTGS